MTPEQEDNVRLGDFHISFGGAGGRFGVWTVDCPHKFTLNMTGHNQFTSTRFTSSRPITKISKSVSDPQSSSLLWKKL